LILDEPTNHLDMRSKDVLKEAIRDFDGTVIVVSHDRDFLDGLVTKVYEFGGGRVKEHLGGIYDFLRSKAAQEVQMDRLDALFTASTKTDAEIVPERQKSVGARSYEEQKEYNKKVKKLEKQVADCEQSITETEAAIAILESQMATPDGAADMSLYEKHGKLKQALDEVVADWERFSEELEELRSEE